MNRSIQRTCGAVACGCLAWLAAAAGWGQSNLPPLPTDPAAWVNSPPLSWEMLKGKGAVFYFFEESCPRCRGEWPNHLQAAAKFQGKPVAFIGVNSGTSAAEVAAYAREQFINWPIIVDADRSFEKAAGLQPLSLQNIWQYMVLTPQGQFRQPRAGFTMAGAGDEAAAGAQWNIDPNGIPAPLQKAWMGVEFGNFASAATDIQKSLKSPQADLKAGAEKLNEYVLAQLAQRLDGAKAAQAAGNKWNAYKQYAKISVEFRGYPLPADADQAGKELAGDEAVKTELAALKRFEAAYKLLGSPSTVTQRRARLSLDALVKDSPTTEAAQQASQVLKQLPQ